MNRRDVMKGSLGAVVAADAAAKSTQFGTYVESGQIPLPESAPEGLVRNVLNAPSADPFWEAKRLFRAHSREVFEQESMKLAYKMDALDDLKSISPAYRRYMKLKLSNEREAMNKRFMQLLDSI